MEATWPDPLSQSVALLNAAVVQPAAHVGTIAVADPSDGLWVRYPGALSEAPVAARTTIPITPADEGRNVLLVFEGGDPARPIVTGFMQEQPVVELAEPARARVDGRRVHLSAEREIALTCGKSSILLRADGKVVIKGVEVVSRARRTNKVKGGTVRIN